MLVGLLRIGALEEEDEIDWNAPPTSNQPGWGPLAIRTEEGLKVCRVAAQERLQFLLADATGGGESSQFDETPGVARSRKNEDALTVRVSNLGSEESGFGYLDVCQMPVPTLHINLWNDVWNATAALSDLDRAEREGVLTPILSSAMRDLFQSAVRHGEAEIAFQSTEESVQIANPDARDYIRRSPVLLCSLEELSASLAWLRRDSGQWAEAIGASLTTEAGRASLLAQEPNQPLTLWLRAFRHLGTSPLLGERNVLLQSSTYLENAGATQEDRIERSLGAILEALPVTYHLADDIRRDLLLSKNRVVREQAVRRMVVKKSRSDSRPRGRESGR